MISDFTVSTGPPKHMVIIDILVKSFTLWLARNLCALMNKMPKQYGTIMKEPKVVILGCRDKDRNENI